jgi:sulfur carrier protein
LKIKVNGKKEEIQEEINILEYLKSKALDYSQLVIQYNGEIIEEDELSEFYLETGDVLEVLKFVGGG